MALETAEEGIRIRGSLTVDTVNLLFRSPPTFTDGKMTVSLGMVDEIDSAGLALLVHWQHSASRAGGDLQYVDVPDQAKSMMQVSGLEQALTG